MAATKQSQVLQLANTINALAPQVLALADQINQLSAQWAALNGQGVLDALGTVAQNADGSLGATDGTPQTGHPINPALYPALARATSSYNYGATLTLLQQIATLVAGGAPAQQAGAVDLLAQMTGG
jgi:hypothetical protein